MKSILVRRLLAASIILVTTGLSGGEFAQGRQPLKTLHRQPNQQNQSTSERGLDPTHHIPSPAALRNAGASEGLIKQLTTLHFEYRMVEVDLRAHEEKAKLTLQNLVDQDDPDEKAVLAAIDAVHLAQGERHKKQVSTMLKTRKLLGKELLEKARATSNPSPSRKVAPQSQRGGEGSRKPPQSDKVRVQFRPAEVKERPKADKLVRPKAE